MKRLIFRKKVVILLIDILIINFSFLLSFYFRFSTDVPVGYLKVYAENSIIITLIFVLSFYLFRMYDSLWRYAGADEFLLIVAACASAGVAVMAYNMIYGGLLPSSILVLGTILLTLFTAVSRAAFRTYRRVMKLLENSQKNPGQRVMIVGAGAGGRMVLEEIRNSNEININAGLLRG